MGGVVGTNTVEAHTLMSGYLLSSQGDRMAMANSIEGRFPFLDHRVIEFATASSALQAPALTEKYILKKPRRVAAEAIRTRTKQPYRAPDSQSFFRDGRALDYVAELLDARRLATRVTLILKAVRKAGGQMPAAVARSAWRQHGVRGDPVHDAGDELLLRGLWAATNASCAAACVP